MRPLRARQDALYTTDFDGEGTGSHGSAPISTRGAHISAAFRGSDSGVPEERRSTSASEVGDDDGASAASADDEVFESGRPSSAQSASAAGGGGGGGDVPIEASSIPAAVSMSVSAVQSASAVGGDMGDSSDMPAGAATPRARPSATPREGEVTPPAAALPEAVSSIRSIDSAVLVDESMTSTPFQMHAQSESGFDNADEPSAAPLAAAGGEARTDASAAPAAVDAVVAHGVTAQGESAAEGTSAAEGERAQPPASPASPAPGSVAGSVAESILSDDDFLAGSDAEHSPMSVARRMEADRLGSAEDSALEAAAATALEAAAQAAADIEEAEKLEAAENLRSKLALKEEGEGEAAAIGSGGEGASVGTVGQSEEAEAEAAEAAEAAALAAAEAVAAEVAAVEAAAEEAAAAEAKAEREAAAEAAAAEFAAAQAVAAKAAAVEAAAAEAAAAEAAEAEAAAAEAAAVKAAAAEAEAARTAAAEAAAAEAAAAEAEAEAAEAEAAEAEAAEAAAAEAAAAEAAAAQAAAAEERRAADEEASRRADLVTAQLLEAMVLEAADALRQRSMSDPYLDRSMSDAPTSVATSPQPPSEAEASTVDALTAVLFDAALAELAAELAGAHAAPRLVGLVTNARGAPAVGAGSVCAPSTASAVSTEAPAPFVAIGDVASAHAFAADLRAEQQQQQGGAGADDDTAIGAAAFERALARLLDRRGRQAGAGADARRALAATDDDDRHLRAWAQLVRDACNEAVSAAGAGDATGMPPARVSNSRARPAPFTMHEAALAPLAAAVPRESSASSGQEAAGIPAGDAVELDELDALVRTSMTLDKRRVQDRVSEGLLKVLVGELADEVEAIDARRRRRRP